MEGPTPRYVWMKFPVAECRVSCHAPDVPFSIDWDALNVEAHDANEEPGAPELTPAEIDQRCQEYLGLHGLSGPPPGAMWEPLWKEAVARGEVAHVLHGWVVLFVNGARVMRPLLPAAGLTPPARIE